MAKMGGPMPMTMGGGPSVVEVEQEALLAGLTDKGFDPTDPAQLAQTWMEATAIASIRAVNRRVETYMVPQGMMESLPVWERACGFRPLPAVGHDTRRDAIDARFAGFAGNNMGRIWDICDAIAGPVFSGFSTPTVPTVYVPGANPGPPGQEYSSNAASFAVVLVRAGRSTPVILELARRIRQELQLVLPSWNSFVIGLNEGGFVPGVGIVGLTLL